MDLSRHQQNALKKLGQHHGWEETENPKLIGENPAIICKTPPTGIPACEGDIAGKASGIPVQFIRPDGKMNTSQRAITVYNPFDNEIPGNTYITCKWVNKGYWVVDNSTPSNNQIIFKILEVYSPAVAESEHCDDKLRDAKLKYKAEILNRPCGFDVVAEEENGTVIVHDDLGSFLEGREEAEVVGKVGVAAYFSSTDDYDECKWIITWIDWFREVQVITNVIVTSNQIKFEVKNVKVWDDCDLDPITIDLTECPTEY